MIYDILYMIYDICICICIICICICICIFICIYIQGGPPSYKLWLSLFINLWLPYYVYGLKPPLYPH